MKRQQLTDNVYLTYVPAEKFKTNFLSAQMITPLAKETAPLNALLFNVLSRGTATYPDLDALGRRLDMLYGSRLSCSIRVRGENHITGFCASCIDDKYLSGGERLLEPLTDLLGESFCSPALQDGHLVPDYVESEKANLIDAIRSDINDKAAYAARRIREEMFAGEPFAVGRLGSAGDMEAITPEALDAYCRTLIPQARLELFYCGSAPEDRVSAAFRHAFAALPRAGGTGPAATTRRPAPGQFRVITEEMDVAQGKLCMGYRTESADTAATAAAAAMFGGSSTSKLFLNVRERLSLCYYASCSYDRDKGYVLVNSGIDPGDYDAAVQEIEAQLEAIRQGDWEEWEMSGTKSYLRNSFRSAEDSPAALENFAVSQAACGGTETIAQRMEAVLAVTPERIMAAAKAIQPDTLYFLKGKETQE